MPNVLLSSRAISSQTFLASLLSSQSNLSAHNRTSTCCSPWVHLSYAFGFLFSPLSSSTELELDVLGLGVLVLERLEGRILLAPSGCWLVWATAGDVLALNTKGSGICCCCIS